MMKKNILYFLLAVLPLCAVSCVDRPSFEGTDGPGINLTVNAPDAEATATVKALPDPRNGEDAYNENLLNSFYYFFYPKDVTDEAPAVSGYVSGISETGIYTRNIPVSSNTINNVLFAEDRECQLFIVANPPASMETALKGSPTLAQLRAMTVLSALKSVPQKNFVMLYDGLVTVASRSQEEAVNVEVALKRLACKFTVGAFVTQSIVKAGKTYEPVTTEGGLKVTFCNGLDRTTLSGFDKEVVIDGDYFDSESVELGYQGTSDIEESGAAVTYHKYSSSSPIYTYPMEWEFASEVEPYLLYDLNWKVTDNESGDTEYKNLYYKLTLGRRSIVSNEWYNIAAKLTVLGSLYPEDPEQVFPYMNYQVLGWKSAYELGGNPNTPAIIKDTRYLSVPQTNWTLNNKNSITIPFSSSHPCRMKPGSLVATDTSLYTSGASYPGRHQTNHIESEVNVDTSVEGQVTVTHTLNNTLGAGMDISPIDITFTLEHTDNPDFNQVITIKQHPAIFVNTELNSSGETETTTHKGYTYVNGGQAESGSYWLRVLGANSGQTGNNTSRYLTVITVTQFDPSTGYVVGDPRKQVVDNLGWTSTSAPAKYKGDGTTANRRLSYYYPTVDDGSRDDFVAPSFRVGSAHCRNGGNDTYANIKQRCASYQEDGYPAGRWRVPTLAECKLIQVLSGNGMVPNIFIQNGSSYYFAAGWWFTISTSGVGNYYQGTSQQSSVRCVYDEWYWSKVDAEFGWDNSGKSFTWGDVPRNYIHNN